MQILWICWTGYCRESYGGRFFLCWVGFGCVEFEESCKDEMKDIVRKLFDNRSNKDESCLLCLRCIVYAEKKVV